MRIASRLRTGLTAAFATALLLVGAWPLSAQQRSAGGALALDPAREIAWYATGLGLLGAAALLPVEIRPVPAAGFDPATLRLEVDREVVGRIDPDAVGVSNVFLVASLAHPVVLAAVLTGDERSGAAARTAVVLGEAVVLAEGVTFVVKGLFDRARPFTYLADAARPNGSAFDVTAERSFRSMPSGHASGAWAAAGFAVSDHLARRPDSSWWQSGLLALGAGTLAATTAELRVRGGQHFPSDVRVGSVIGVAVGWGVRSSRSGWTLPDRQAWLGAVGGLALGAVLGPEVARRF